MQWKIWKEDARAEDLMLSYVSGDKSKVCNGTQALPAAAAAAAKQGSSPLCTLAMPSRQMLQAVQCGDGDGIAPWNASPQRFHSAAAFHAAGMELWHVASVLVSLLCC